MKSNIRVDMSFDNLVKRMENLLDNQNVIQEMLTRLRDLRVMDDCSMNKLYIIIVNASTDERFSVMQQNIDNNAIIEWIHQIQQERASMSKKSLTQLLEILEIRLNYIIMYKDLSDLSVTVKDDQINQMQKDNLQKTQSLLSCLYNLVIRSDDSAIFEQFMSCICIVHSITPDNINKLLYAQMISDCQGRDKEFYGFFTATIKINSFNDSIKIRKHLLKGLTRRMKNLLAKNQLMIEEKDYIASTYGALAQFLLENFQSDWPQTIIESYGEIIACLKAFLSKNIHTNIMAMICNKLIKAFMSSKMPNFKKFDNVLAIYKAILQKAPRLYPFIKTDFLTDEQDFLAWFTSKQLVMQSAQYISTFYLQNQFSMQFFLLMVIFVVNSSTTDEYKKQEIKKLMRCVSLLDEAKYFMHKKDIMSCLAMLYRDLHEAEELEEYLNRVEDQHLFAC